MNRIVIRPRIQITLLIAIFALFGLIGLGYFVYDDVVAKRDWFGIVLGSVLIVMAAVGIWRTLRLGVVIDVTGVRVRGLDHRDRVTPWSGIQSVECAQIDARAGLPLYAPVIILDGELGGLPVRPLGSYSRSDVERTVRQLRDFMGNDQADG